MIHPPEIAVVGGVYEERCLVPQWNEVFGSAGRAASTMAALGAPVTLHTHLDAKTLSVLESRAALEGFRIAALESSPVPVFDYIHGLDVPRICGLRRDLQTLRLECTAAVCFGMIDADAVITADHVVYDPQNARDPRSFRVNGSTAAKLALVLNRHEAHLLARDSTASPKDLATILLSRNEADVVVLKMGPLGVYVHDGTSDLTIPAFRSSSVWKIGTGDCFTGSFAYHWLVGMKSPADAARLASIGTSYFAETRGYASAGDLGAHSPIAVRPSARFCEGWRPTVYLAGPFFTLGQTWLVDQAFNALRGVGLKVFSPYHDVGRGSAEDVVSQDLEGLEQADLMLAIADGFDPGTLFEIGYARARSKPVVVYCENESKEECKMLHGSKCQLRSDFVTAVYETLWNACEL